MGAMGTLDEQRDSRALPEGTAACLGAFDGLHIGHQALIERARTMGQRVGLVTFDPHPRQVLTPDRAPRLLHTDEQRRRVARSLGIRNLALLPFDRVMAQMPPEQFARQLLIDGLRPSAVVVGADFRFGRAREGTAQGLVSLLAPAGIDVAVVPPVPVPEAARQSPANETTGDRPKLGATAIRNAVEAGQMQRAGVMLGRWHSVMGTVVHGARRGRTIGFPTANIGNPGAFVPPVGVYAGYLSVWTDDSPHVGSVWPAAVNVGHNPTFTADNNAPPLHVEAHVIDQALGEDLYDLDVEVHFVARLRDERRFDGPDALVAQLHADVDECRQHFGPHSLARVVGPAQARP